MMKHVQCRVLLVGAEDEENLSIRYLGASLVRQGHNVEIMPCSKYEDIPKVINAIKKFKPNLIGISIAFQCLANMFFKLVSEIRESGYGGNITVGGHFPTFEYKKILETQDSIDDVVRFEGEQAIVELAEFCGGNRELSSVTNLVYRNLGDIRENTCIYKFRALDDLPFPLRNKRPQIRLGEKFATLVASRGCWHSSCLYCCIGAFHLKKEGKKYALRTPKNIAKEISELYHKQGVRLFQFHDDNFMLASKEDNMKRFQDLKSELENEKINLRNIAFLIKARPDSIDEEVVSVLKELGVVGVFLGIENASETGLRSLIRGSTLQSIDNALKTLKRHDIIVTYNLLVFHPNSTLDEINENIRFIKNNIDYPFDFGRAEIVAGSPLEKQVIQDKLLRGTWPNWDYKIKDANVEQMFKINLATFRRKGSSYSKLAHSLIALSYRAYVVNRLYPGPSSKDILTGVNDLICRSNRFILDNIFQMYKLTAKLKSEDELDDLFNLINIGCNSLIGEAEKLSARMSKLQILENKFRNAGIGQYVQDSKSIRSIFRI